MIEIGYYRLVVPFKDLKNHTVGELFYLTHVECDTAHIIQGGSHGWTMDLNELNLHFEFAPNGLQERQQEMQTLMEDIHTESVQQDQLSLTANDTPHIEGGQAMGLAVLGNRSPEVIRDKLKSIKTNFAKVNLSLMKKSTALKVIIDEQRAILEAKTKALMTQISKANEQIDVIRIYLGDGEELIQIQEGEPADPNEKIMLRQLILFMDEESAIAAEKGGIDFQEIEKFDEWVKKPKHLEQIIPEKKGIVALKIRRNDKDYGGKDRYSDAIMNMQNKTLYILIRNGDNLYRIYSALQLHNVLFPRKDDFEKYFYESKWNSKLKEYQRVPLDPGSREYMKKMDEAEKEQRHYFKVLILLQGLMDRTKVFQPMPTEGRINLCNFEEYNQYLQFIYDAESLLPTGRMPYRKWLKEANSKIEVGHRVIGNFQNWSIYKEEKRIFPRTCWNKPEEKTLYTIEGRAEERHYSSGKEFYFLFDRNEEVYRGRWEESGPAKKRARYVINESDTFWLNFDAVNAEDMEYFVSSRTERHHYMEMIPLMRLAIKLKHEETKQEAPFRKLLLGEIIKKYKHQIDTVEDKLSDLVNWWKFKNKTHRALTSDDAKALRMIVAEYGRRSVLDDQAQIQADLDAKTIEQLKTDNTLAVFQVNQREFVTLSWYNDRNVFVKESRWKSQNEGFVLVADKEWKIVDNRHLSWRKIWSHERLDAWKINARASEHLTDPEIQQGFDFLMKGLKEKSRYFGLENNSWEKSPTRPWGLPLYGHITEDGKASLIYAQKHALVPKQRVITEYIYPPEIGMMVATFEKTKNGIKFYYDLKRSFTYRDSHHMFEEENEEYQSVLKAEDRPLFFSQANIDKVAAEFTLSQHAKTREKSLKNLIDPVENQMRHIAVERHWEREKTKFFEQYQDEELWEAEKKKRGTHYDYQAWVENAIGNLVEVGIDPHGMTVAEVVEQAKKDKVFDEDRIEHFEKEWLPMLDVVVDMHYKLPQLEDEDDDEECEDEEECETEDQEDETLLLTDESAEIVEESDDLASE